MTRSAAPIAAATPPTISSVPRPEEFEEFVGPPGEEAFTVRVAVALAFPPTESLTFTRTEKLPVTVGVHDHVELFWVTQPVGSPE